MNRLDQTIGEKGKSIGYRSSCLGLSMGTVIFFSVLAVLNLHLFGLGNGRIFIFSPSEFESGQWWRLFTHPFVHVTWYHLLLDAGAFLFLFKGLEKQNTISGIIHVVICGIGSLGATLVFSPVIYSRGLCGLSGIAHGLMAVFALELMQYKNDFRIGLISLVLLISKCIYEVIVGDVLFSFLHFGLCGSPLVSCHAGGVMSGIFSFYVMRWANSTFGKPNRDCYEKNRNTTFMMLLEEQNSKYLGSKSAIIRFMKKYALFYNYQ